MIGLFIRRAPVVYPVVARTRFAREWYQRRIPEVKWILLKSASSSPALSAPSRRATRASFDVALERIERDVKTRIKETIATMRKFAGRK
jgi:hypothetical protein